MPDGRSEEGHGAAHTDQDPLLNGEDSTVLSRIRRSFPTFSFRSWRRSNSNSAAETVPQHDVETGTAASVQSLGHENDAEAGHPSEGASSSTAGEIAVQSPSSRQNSAEFRVPGDSPTARQGILGGLLRLGSTALPRSSNSSLSLTPTCLICLETLTSEDFESGDAIALDCQCRGDMAMRHRTCAEKWAHVKGNRICDICKMVVKNLPEVTPRAPDSATSQGGANAFDEHDPIRNSAQHFAAEQVPGGADVVFDCIRVTWVAMIICILFFEMSLANALWTGLIVGMAYTLFVRAMYRHQLSVMLREQHQQRNAAETPIHAHVVHVV